MSESASCTSAELREINRKMQSPTGRRILWEIYRLRKITLLADCLESSLSADPTFIEVASQEITARELRQALDELP